MAGKYSSGINNLDIINNEEPQEQCTGEEQCSSEQAAVAVPNATPSKHTYIVYHLDADSPQSPPPSPSERSLNDGEMESEDK